MIREVKYLVSNFTQTNWYSWIFHPIASFFRLEKILFRQLHFLSLSIKVAVWNERNTFAATKNWIINRFFPFFLEIPFYHFKLKMKFISEQKMVWVDRGFEMVNRNTTQKIIKDELENNWININIVRWSLW